MNTKKTIPLPVILGILGVVVVIVLLIGFKAVSGPERQAASAPEMYDAVKQMALKSQGDYSKLSPEDQKYLEAMSHGHGAKLLSVQYQKVVASGGK